MIFIYRKACCGGGNIESEHIYNILKTAAEWNCRCQRGLYLTVPLAKSP
jgi:hypothetical protein